MMLFFKILLVLLVSVVYVATLFAFFFLPLLIVAKIREIEARRRYYNANASTFENPLYV